MNLKKLIGEASLLLAIALSIYTATVILMAYRSNSTRRLEAIWQEDIKNLSESKNLPMYWYEIRSIEKHSPPQDQPAGLWSRSLSVPLEVNPKGEYQMEILFLSQSDGGHLRAIIQHHIIHTPTGNSVWELGRTYTLW